MILRMRMSVDGSHTQRYTEEQVVAEFAADNIKIEHKLVIRKNDGAVMGEILSPVDRDKFIAKFIERVSGTMYKYCDPYDYSVGMDPLSYDEVKEQAGDLYDELCSC